MPKSILIDPKDVRKKGILTINSIPLNQYTPDIKKELELYGKEKLQTILYHMIDRKSVV